jgi:hypothetical protein
MQDPNELKRELLDKIRVLRSNCKGEKKPSMLSLLRTISQNACEAKINCLLQRQGSHEVERQFDPYYKLKSDFATLKILELLKLRLSAEGLDITILTEAPNDYGRHDIVLAQENTCKDNANVTKKVRIEVKASLGLDFEQLDRYLWDPSPIILVRVITGHVVKLDPSTFQSYIHFSLAELNAKVDRLISSKFYKIPGKECASCYDRYCEHNYRNRLWRAPCVITMSDEDFNEDLNRFLQNLRSVAEKTVSLALGELESTHPNPE